VRPNPNPNPNQTQTQNRTRPRTHNQQDQIPRAKSIDSSSEDGAAAATLRAARTFSGPLPAADTKPLPWFGVITSHCLVPAKGGAPGAPSDPDVTAAVLTLCEGGELFVLDLGRGTGRSVGGAAVGDEGGGSRGQTPVQPQQQQGPPRGYRARLQAQPRVTAVRVATLPVEPLKLQGLQVRGWGLG